MFVLVWLRCIVGHPLVKNGGFLELDSFMSSARSLPRSRKQGGARRKAMLR
jgi:hypothetical protein